MVFRSHVKWKDRKQIYTNFVEGVVAQILSPVYTKAHSDLLTVTVLLENTQIVFGFEI